MLSEECIKRNLNIAVAGIPKTIDNDVDLIDRCALLQHFVILVLVVVVSGIGRRNFSCCSISLVEAI